MLLLDEWQPSAWCSDHRGDSVPWIDSCTTVGWGSGLNVPNRVSADETWDWQFLIFHRNSNTVLKLRSFSACVHQTIPSQHGKVWLNTRFMFCFMKCSAPESSWGVYQVVVNQWTTTSVPLSWHDLTGNKIMANRQTEKKHILKLDMRTIQHKVNDVNHPDEYLWISLVLGWPIFFLVGAWCLLWPRFAGLRFWNHNRWLVCI